MENTSHECRDKLKQELAEVSDKQETSICRGCLTTEHRMVNAMVFNTLFRDLTGITISPTDGLPQWLCYECSALLHKYNRFRSKVIESHHKLCQYMLESVMFAVKKDATPHLSRTSVLHFHIAGTQTDKLEEQIDDNYDTDMLCETENVKVKEEPTFFDYEDNIVEEECRTPQTQVASSLSISDPLDIHIAVTVKREAEATEEEQEDQTNKVDDDTDAPVLTKQESVEFVEDPLYRGYKRKFFRQEIAAPVQELTRLRQDIVHVPKNQGRSNRKRCCICHRKGIDKKVTTFCVTCDVHICFEGCWTDWHSLQELPGQDFHRRNRKRRA